MKTAPKRWDHEEEQRLADMMSIALSESSRLRTWIKRQTEKIKEDADHGFIHYTEDGASANLKGLELRLRLIDLACDDLAGTILAFSRRIDDIRSGKARVSADGFLERLRSPKGCESNRRR